MKLELAATYCRRLSTLLLLTCRAGALKVEANESLPAGKVHLVAFRSFSQNPDHPENQKYFRQLKDLSKVFERFPSVTEHHLHYGFPHALEVAPKWAGYFNEGMKGHGFWFWKPALINMMIAEQKIEDGDIVLWLDADAAHVNFDQIQDEQLSSYLHDSSWDIFVKEQPFCEFDSTKGDIFDRFNVAWDDPQYGLSMQVHSELSVFKVNSKSRQFLQMWEDLMSDFHLVNDAKSIAPNPKIMFHNRHDQSIISMLAKANVMEPTGTTPIYSEMLQKCAQEAGLEPKASFTRSLHPEFGIPGLKVVVGDLAKEVLKQKVPAPTMSLIGGMPGHSGLARQSVSLIRTLCWKDDCTVLRYADDKW